MNYLRDLIRYYKDQRKTSLVSLSGAINISLVTPIGNDKY